MMTHYDGSHVQHIVFCFFFFGGGGANWAALGAHKISGVGAKNAVYYKVTKTL
jgi:hypothetical protein